MQQESKRRPVQRAPRQEKARRPKKKKNGRGYSSNDGRTEISFPKLMGVMQNGSALVQRFKFGTAAPHDDFPNGGLRVVGELPNVSDDSLGFYGGSSYTAAFAATAGTPGGGALVGVCPLAIYSNAISPSYAMLGLSSPLAYQSFNFKRFRFRQLYMVYESTCGSNVTGSMQIAYQQDFASLAGNLTRTTTQTAAATENAARFPVWAPRVVIPLITERKSSGADRLYENVNQAVTATSQGAFNQCFQGGISAYHDQPAAASLIVGRFRIGFVLDLYDFGTVNVDGSVSLSQKKNPLLRQEELKAESSDSELVDIPPVLLKRIPPPQDQGLTPANTPAGSKNSVKSLSLR